MTILNCKNCNATGFLKIKNFRCKYCDNNNCYLCVNITEKNFYESCSLCEGLGFLKNQNYVYIDLDLDTREKNIKKCCFIQ